nr:immunoglobulin heavy chain junction region [Macaca mulatta]MOV49306.1 immunoglobulin heavy chain junction region [Macaca mulatta]MOV49404.1 immunoglobulin heavy chain junction region [Macaca mulatta]MOV49421.1 immunoglobulin heavy chain junction region [Macaca mulatta]MOV49600.1 immunoglobulin heavy chain junction region [Macaca mulatta]
CAIHRFNGNYNRYYFEYW